jgi:hypothetical protein
VIQIFSHLRDLEIAESVCLASDLRFVIFFVLIHFRMLRESVLVSFNQIFDVVINLDIKLNEEDLEVRCGYHSLEMTFSLFLSKLFFLD